MATILGTGKWIASVFYHFATFFQQMNSTTSSTSETSTALRGWIGFVIRQSHLLDALPVDCCLSHKAARHLWKIQPLNQRSMLCCTSLEQYRCRKHSVLCYVYIRLPLDTSVLHSRLCSPHIAEIARSCYSTQHFTPSAFLVPWKRLRPSTRIRLQASSDASFFPSQLLQRVHDRVLSASLLPCLC